MMPCQHHPFALRSLLVVMLSAVRTHAAPVGNFTYERSNDALTLAKAGQPQYVIVDPTGTNAPVQFAADELKEHLDRMAGGEFQVAGKIPDHGRAIVLGDCPEARKAGIDVGAIGRDGYAIRTVGPTIFITGKDDATEKSSVLLKLKTEPFPRTAGRYAMEARFGAATWDFERGTLYGVYRFLEELGVRWFFPGPKGVVIPAKPDLNVQAFSLREEPVYQLRKVGSETWQWYLLDVEPYKSAVNRQEYEELGWGGDVLRLWLLRMRGSSEWFAFNHRPPRLELEERFGKEHPDYFALRENGERDLKPQTGRTGHMCYTHPGVLQLMKDDIDAYFGGKTGKEMGFSAHQIALNPHNRGWSANASYGRTVSLLPHDSFRACKCENCQRFVHEDWDRSACYSELVWQYVEKMAKWMEGAHPDKLLTCLAYSYYTEKPKDLTRLPNNVVVGLCAANYARTHNCVAEENYADFMRLVRTWSAVNERPMLIWMHHLYRHLAPRRKGVPMLLTGLFGRMFRDLAKHANLMHVELDYDSLMLEQLNRYVMLKLLYNPNLDPEEIVADYARSSFGPGADLVLPVLKDIETRSMAVARTSSNNIDTWEKHFTEDAVKGYREKTDELLKLTANTPHAQAAQVFSKWFVGAIEEGRELYVHNVKEVAESKDASVSIRALVGDIKIDGALDEEGWQRSSVRGMINNLDGKPTQWKTEVRFLRAPENLYFSFKCFDPGAANLSTKQGEADSVEIFLDPEHDHDSYHWLWIDLGGRVEDWYFEGGGEPPDKTWNSEAEIATKQYDDHWTIEVRLPRKNLTNGTPDPVGRPWGANFGRSVKHPPELKDQFSCWSPLLRGKFHQPDLFGHLFFVK